VCSGYPQQCPLLPKGVQGVSGQGDETELGHAGAGHQQAGAVDGHLGQAWEEAGERFPAAPASSDGEDARNRVRRWQDLSMRISDQLRAHNVPLEFAALSRWKGPHVVVPGGRTGEWAE